MNNQQCIIGVVNDVVTAKKLWQELSPAETIYDDFEFRETFRKYYGSQFFFYTASVDGKIVGLLPLQTVEDGSALEFFGGDYMEDNRVFTKPGFEYCIPELYQHLDRPAHLDFIRGIDAYTQTFPIVDYKYVLPLQQFATIDDYVAYAYEGKAWRDFNRKLRNVENSGITVAYDQYEDVDFLFKTNIEHYKDSANDNRGLLHSGDILCQVRSRRTCFAAGCEYALALRGHMRVVARSDIIGLGVDGAKVLESGQDVKV
jgi:hypothetical protein